MSWFGNFMDTQYKFLINEIFELYKIWIYEY